MEYLWQAVIKYWSRMFWLEAGVTEGPQPSVVLRWDFISKTSALRLIGVMTSAVLCFEGRNWAQKSKWFAPVLMTSTCPSVNHMAHEARTLFNNPLVAVRARKTKTPHTSHFCLYKESHWSRSDWPRFRFRLNFWVWLAESESTGLSLHLTVQSLVPARLVSF